MTARFDIGDRVEVLSLEKEGHVRIPFYIRGQEGTVVQYCGRYLNPENLAVGNMSGPGIDLYRVEFQQTELWTSPDHLPQDRLIIEIYDHWLKISGS
ncbi:MAG: SH3-like domain-containing protein [Hyphomicrobiales bacterium]